MVQSFCFLTTFCRSYLFQTNFYERHDAMDDPWFESKFSSEFDNSFSGGQVPRRVSKM